MSDSELRFATVQELPFCRPAGHECLNMSPCHHKAVKINAGPHGHAVTYEENVNPRRG